MSKWFTLMLAGIMLIGFCSCGSTPSGAEGDLNADIAKMRAQQEKDVSRLESKQNWDGYYRQVGSDLKRHNWVEWPVAIALWGVSFLSTGHQRRDFVKMHQDMDRYFFNAAWDDPYLND